MSDKELRKNVRVNDGLSAEQCSKTFGSLSSTQKSLNEGLNIDQSSKVINQLTVEEKKFGLNATQQNKDIKALTGDKNDKKSTE